MDQKTNNTSALSDFVHSHELQNRHSVTHFSAIVSIDTAENKISNLKIQIFIEFDGYDNYGKLSFMHDNLDPILYPTVFDAKYGRMEHRDGVYLLISDNHTRNPKIGKYTVKIVPLERLSD